MTRAGTYLVVTAVAVLALGASAARADWDGAVKWDQVGPPSAWGLNSFVCTDTGAEWLAADDFRCTSPEPVAEIRFCGWSTYGTEYIDQFRVRFWEDVPATAEDESHPGRSLMEVDVGPVDPRDPLGIGWQYVPGYEFLINLPEEHWFYQEGTESDPKIYWIGIQGLMVEDGLEDKFLWVLRDPTVREQLDDAAMWNFDLHIWTNMGWVDDEPGYEGELYPRSYDGPFPGYPPFVQGADLEFSLSTPEPATLALVGLGVAGLVASRRRRRK